MKIGNRSFRPKLLPSLVFIALLPALIALGIWQWNRGMEKYHLRDVREENAKKAPIRLDGYRGSEKDLLGREVIVRGRFDLEKQLLLHNQKYREEPGFLIFAPFRLEHEDRVILVNRGWLSTGMRLSTIPDLPGPGGLIELRGRIEHPPSVGLKLGEPDAGKMGWPRAVIYIDMDWLTRQMGYHFMPNVLWLESGETYGLVRDWAQFDKGREQMPPEKHMGYAFQWFSLALALCVIYIVVNLKKTED